MITDKSLACCASHIGGDRVGGCCDPDDCGPCCEDCPTCPTLTMVETSVLDEWRASRRPGWYKDVGYRLQQVLTSHCYDYKRKGAKPDDPGWHECSCGEWEGYWSGFRPHVADHLRASVVDWAEDTQ